MTEIEKWKKTAAQCVSNLLLADHMGDAHDSTLQLARALWGPTGVEDCLEKIESGEISERLRRRLAEYEPEIWKEDGA